MNDFSIGLCSVSFRKHTPAEILEEMKKAGLTRIEWGSDVHAPADHTEALLSLRRLQEEYGVTCSSYGTYFKVGVHPAEELFPLIRAAKILGTSVLRVWAGDKNSEDFTEAEKEAFFKECNFLSYVAFQEGVTLCTECHNKTYTNRSESALELMENAYSPTFRTYWQPNQFRDEAYNLASAETLSRYTKNIHVFHWREKEKFPLADGREVWKKYLRCFGGSKTLLLEFMPDGRLESLQSEASALRNILEELE